MQKGRPETSNALHATLRHPITFTSVHSAMPGHAAHAYTVGDIVRVTDLTGRRQSY